MASHEWPIAHPERPVTAPCVLQHARDDARLADAAASVANASARPLPDADRARVPVIVEELVGRVEADLRLHALRELAEARLPELLASLGSASVSFARARLQARAGWPRGLLAAALARAEMHRLVSGIAPRPRDLDGPAAGERMALLVAESRRVDRFGEPVLELDDLPAEAAHALVWALAAGLRAALNAGGLDDRLADRLAVAAGRDRLGRYDEGAGLPAIAGRLVQAMAGAGVVDDALLLRMADTGELPALAAAFAYRTGLPATAVWPLLAEPGEGRLALLVRAADLGREAAAEVLLRFLRADDDPATELDRYDRCDLGQAREALAALGHDPVYRDALRDLERA